MIDSLDCCSSLLLGRISQIMVGKIESSTPTHLILHGIWGGLGTGIRSLSFEMRPRQRFKVFNVKWIIFPLFLVAFQKGPCLGLIIVAEEGDRHFIPSKIEF